MKKSSWVYEFNIRDCPNDFWKDVSKTGKRIVFFKAPRRRGIDIYIFKKRVEINWVLTNIT